MLSTLIVHVCKTIHVYQAIENTSFFFFSFPFSFFLKFKKLSKQFRHSMQDQSDYCTRVNAALIKIVSVGESVRKIYEECHDMPREEKKNRNIQSI